MKHPLLFLLSALLLCLAILPRGIQPAHALTGTVCSTELVSYSGMSTSQINSFLTTCKNQGMTEITCRLAAYDDWSRGAPSTSETSTTKALITAATGMGISVNLDMHSWFTTFINSLQDGASNYLSNRQTYKNYVVTTINTYAGYPVKAWQLMNEPVAATVPGDRNSPWRKATTSENQFIVDVVEAAQAVTSKPVSVRFAGGYNPQTGTFASAIDEAADYLARNTYWDARSPNTPMYGCSQATINAWISTSNSLSKELWITEVGTYKSNEENQRAYLEAFVAYAITIGIERVFGWCCDPTGVAVSEYDLFDGFEPRPAFLELVGTAQPETPKGTLRVTATNNGVAVTASVTVAGTTRSTPCNIELEAGTYTVSATYNATANSSSAVVRSGEVTNVNFAFNLQTPVPPPPPANDTTPPPSQEEPVPPELPEINPNLGNNNIYTVLIIVAVVALLAMPKKLSKRKLHL